MGRETLPVLAAAAAAAVVTGVSLALWARRGGKHARRRRVLVEDGNELLDRYDAFVFDCDGVLWSGPDLVDGSVKAVARLRELGKKVFFYTNASTSSRTMYLEKFKRLGIEAQAHEVHTSGTSAALYLKSKGLAGQRVYVLGEQGLVDELTQAGMEAVVDDPVQTFGSQPKDLGKIEVDPTIRAVVIGMDSWMNYHKLAYANLCLRLNDALFVATNPDRQFPVSGRLLPANGCWVAALSVAAEREPDVVTGKPNPVGLDLIMHENALTPSRVLMVGDRLDTDIQFGNSAGTDTMLVLTGCTDVEMAAAATDPAQIPHFVAPSVSVFCE